MIFGKQPVLYAIERHSDMIETLFVAKELDKKLFNRLKSAKKPIEVLDFKKAQALSRGQNHQGMLAKIRAISFASDEIAFKTPFALICVGLTDTGNLGAITRTAYALGVGAIVICGVNGVNLEALIRTSSGAALDMPIALMPNTPQTLERFRQKGFFLIGGTLDGISLRDYKRREGKKALVLGAEGNGLNARSQSKLDLRLRIDMAHNFDSLNVSAAAAILIERIREQ
ncbi:MAG: RNA methyltransferase [Helicobacteraceae bacterium]|nr:RNA methyltransferase [Helicobacteraceae bacterium]